MASLRPSAPCSASSGEVPPKSAPPVMPAALAMPAVLASSRGGRRTVPAWATGTEKMREREKTAASLKQRGFTAPPGLEVLPGGGSTVRVNGLPVLAAASAVGYGRLPSSRRVGRQLTAVKPRHGGHLQNARGVGLAEASKNCYRCFRPITEQHQCPNHIN